MWKNWLELCNIEGRPFNTSGNCELCLRQWMGRVIERAAKTCAVVLRFQRVVLQRWRVWSLGSSGGPSMRKIWFHSDYISRIQVFQSQDLSRQFNPKTVSRVQDPGRIRLAAGGIKIYFQPKFVQLFLLIASFPQTCFYVLKTLLHHCQYCWQGLLVDKEEWGKFKTPRERVYACRFSNDCIKIMKTRATITLASRHGKLPF